MENTSGISFPAILSSSTQGYVTIGLEDLPEDVLRLITAYLRENCSTVCNVGHEFCLFRDESRCLRSTCTYLHKILSQDMKEINTSRCVSISEMLGKGLVMYDVNDPLEDPLLYCTPYVYYAPYKPHPARHCICAAYASAVRASGSAWRLESFVDTWSKFRKQAENYKEGKITLEMQNFQYLHEWMHFVRDCGIIIDGLKAFIVRKRDKVVVHWIARSKSMFNYFL